MDIAICHATIKDAIGMTETVRKVPADVVVLNGCLVMATATCIAIAQYAVVTPETAPAVAALVS